MKKKRGGEGRFDRISVFIFVKVLVIQSLNLVMAVALTSYNELKRNPVFKKVEILNETKKSEPAIFQPSSLKTLCLQKITAFNKVKRS